MNRQFLPFYTRFRSQIGHRLEGIYKFLTTIRIPGIIDCIDANKDGILSTKEINAAVVGLLISALYNPVLQSGIQSNVDVVIALGGFFALRVFGVTIVLLVVSFGIAGAILA